MGVPVFRLERASPERVFTEPTPEHFLHLAYIGQKLSRLRLQFLRIQLLAALQVVGELRRRIGIELRCVDPISMIADQQTSIRMLFGQPLNAQPPSIHARNRVLDNFTQTLRQPVFGR